MALNPRLRPPFAGPNCVSKWGSVLVLGAILAIVIGGVSYIVGQRWERSALPFNTNAERAR